MWNEIIVHWQVDRVGRLIPCVFCLCMQRYQVWQHSGGFKWSSEACGFWIGKTGDPICSLALVADCDMHFWNLTSLYLLALTRATYTVPHSCSCKSVCLGFMWPNIWNLNSKAQRRIFCYSPSVIPVNVFWFKDEDLAGLWDSLFGR
jgi:hypothetical protein